MAINPTKLLPPSSGALALRSKTTDIGKKKSGGLEGQVLVIKTQVIKIEKLISRGYTLKLKEQKEEQKELEKNKRSKKEEELEEKKPPKEGKGKIPSLPKLGFFDRIKNFIGKTLLAYFAVRLIDHLPKLVPFVTALGNASEFLLDVGGNLLNGLVTFIDWGYKAYDATRGFLKNLGGDNFTKVFDTFNGAVGNLIETAIIAATVLATQGEGGVLDVGMDMLKDRLLGKGAQAGAKAAGKQVAGQVGRTAGMGAGAVAGIVAGAGLLASALGEGAFQVRKVAVKPIQNLEKAYKEDKNPLTKIGRGIALTMVRPLYGVFSTVGFLLDVVGAPFRYAIELLRYPFLSEEDKQKQATNLAKFDTRIREDLRKALNMVTLGLAFKEKGSFGNIFGNKGAQNQMMGKMAGGGITRGGKKQGAIRRSGSESKGKGKIKRKLFVAQKPREIEFDTPGSDIGGEDKIFGIFPNPLRGAKKVLDAVNPFKTIENTGKNLGKTDYFGPILAITSKITLGQKPTEQDYKQVGLGINLLVSEGIRDGQLRGGVAAFAEGGFVDPKTLEAISSGGDITNWVAKTFKDATETNAQRTLRQIRENANKEKPETVEKYGQQQPGGDPSLDVGPGATVTGGNADFWTLVAIARMEDSDPQGSADVAQAIYNRVASGIYGARTIKEIVLRQGQFEPTWKYPRKGKTGVPNPEWHSIKDLKTASVATGISQSDLQKTAAALRNSKYQEEARKFVGGRTDFMGGSNQPGPGDVRRKENAPNNFFGWFVGPAAKAYGAKNPGPARAPQLGDIVVMSGGGAGADVQLGKGYGSGGSKIAGELGRFLKKKLKAGAQYSQIHRHPEHPPYSLTSGHSRGSLHYQGRALDIGAYTYEQGPILAAISEFNKMKGVKPVQLLHGKNEPSNHGNHVHVAYEKGGMTKHGPHLAMIGERGREFVIDADSTAAIESTFPGFLDAINRAKYDDAINVLRNFATYEDGSQEEVIVVQNQPSQEESYQNPMVVAMGGLSGGDSYDPFEMLDRLPG